MHPIPRLPDTSTSTRDVGTESRGLLIQKAMATVTLTKGPERALPPNNRPPRRLFVGRDEELRLLREALAEPGTATLTQQAGLYGLGGVGKTALAIEHAYREAKRYPGGIWWLVA